MTRKKTPKKNPWASRFAKGPSAALLAFTESLSYDRRLGPYDVRGSLAHVAMLAKIGVLKPAEHAKLKKGLLAIGREIADGSFPCDLSLEDIHMNVETRLTKKLGPLGGKVHTGRSRNDQVAVDVKMWLKDEIGAIETLLAGFLKSLVDLAEKNVQLVMPGYTHLQQAQPVSAGHYLMAHAHAARRDLENFREAFRKTDVLPLGVGALAGVNYASDRTFLAKELGFGSVTENSIDTVGDRDYQAFFLFSCAMLQTHLSRFAEDLVIFNSSEFQYVTLDDAFTTGSSIMPNKKNPDILELIRGKTGRVLGNLQALLVILKGLPTGYNRDLQEDKPILFDTADTVRSVLAVFTALLKNISFNRDAIRRSLDKNFMLATDLADYLVGKGVPFRDAHRAAGEAVRYCVVRCRNLQDLSLDELRKFNAGFGPDVLAELDYERSVNKKVSRGGTSLSQVKASIRKFRRSLS
jgi:argininosuccinate lyase